MKIIRSLSGLLVRVETVLLVLFLTAMIVLAFAQVVMRNAFGAAFLWGDPLVRHLVLWVGFMGAAVAAREGRHIGIDALTKFMPPRVVSLTRVITSLFAAAVCYFLADAAWEYLQEEIRSGADSPLPVPVPVALSILPAGYVLLLVHFTLAAVEHAGAAIGRQAGGEG